MDEEASDDYRQWASFFRLGTLITPALSEEDRLRGVKDVTFLRATVKRLLPGVFQVGDMEPLLPYIRCEVDTDFGPLDIIHAYEQVPEEMRDAMKPGSEIVCTVSLSADVAIYDYENGAVYDEENVLSMLCDVFGGGEVERIRSLLTEETVQVSARGTVFTGVEEIMGHFHKVDDYGRNHPDDACISGMGTIIGYRSQETKALPIGKRIAVLAYGNPDNIEAFAAITLDDAGKLARIEIITDPDYTFRID